MSRIILASFVASASALTVGMPAVAPRSCAPKMSLSAGEQEPIGRRQFLRTSAVAAMGATLLTAASPAQAKAKNSVFFTNVKDGDTVPSKFTYKFDVTGYTVSPAAEGLKEGTGHHHMIIDGPGAFFTQGEAIPMDATHKHYGKAQSEGELELEPGKHKITLQFANAYHQSYGKEFAKTITVNVKDGA